MGFLENIIMALIVIGVIWFLGKLIFGKKREKCGLKY